jgi:hypothetical protein
MLRKNGIYFYLRIFLFAVYLIHGIFIIRMNSMTGDEMDHWSYGKRILKQQPQKIYTYDDASAMPITALNALPRAVQQLLNPDLKKTDGGFSDVMNGRYITLLVCLLIGVYVYRWAKEQFGETAGLFSLFLFVFCPNLNANLTQLATDGYAAFFTLTSAYYFRKIILNAGWRYFTFFSINLGLAQVSKQSLILLIFFFGIIALIVLLQRGSLLKRWKINLARLVILILIILFIINLAFLFNGTGRSLSQYDFRSAFFQHLQQVKLINSLPLPLPAPFIEGFDIVKYMLSLGSGHEETSYRSYLFGKYFTGNAVPYYYSAIILFKTPLTVLLLLAGVIIAYAKRFFSKKNFFITGFPLALALFFIIFFSFFNTSQHSIRHLVMIYPLFYVCLGQVMTWKISQPGLTKIILVLYSLATFYFYFPNLISYTNELIWEKKNAYKVLASSNIDYYQSVRSLVKYLDKHREVKIAGDSAQAGTFVLGINDYLDLKGTGQFAWLRNFEPVGHINHCYLLFHLSEDDLVRKKIK